MRPRSIVLACAVGVLIGSAVWISRGWPRYTHIAEGYLLADFPASGLRYIIDEAGLKRVGQQVLSYRVDGRMILGSVRRSLGDSTVEAFRLDMDTARVEYLRSTKLTPAPQ